MEDDENGRHLASARGDHLSHARTVSWVSCIFCLTLALSSSLGMLVAVVHVYALRCIDAALIRLIDVVHNRLSLMILTVHYERLCEL